MKRRLVAIGLFTAAIVIFGDVGHALAVTPTPTPTPQPTGGAVHSFPVDNYAQLPWPLPNMPTFPAVTPSPTLYAATAAHATDYANTVGTATAQIGDFTGPANQLSTPIAQLSTLAPAESGGDISTGMDLDGTGIVTFASFAADMGDKFTEFFDAIRSAIASLLSMGETFPFLVPAIVATVGGFVLSIILRLAGMIIKSGIALYNFVKGILQFIGIWKPG